MASNFKLSYFNITALGEPIRFLFSYGGIPFEDNRVERESWPQLKPSMPFGQMPTLEYDGKITHQSVAISRFIAKKVKLVGKDDWEDLEIDAAVDTVNDLRSKIGLYHYEQNEELKKSRKETLFNETIPYYLERLDAQAGKNNGYLAVGRLTWADLFFVSLLDYINVMVGKDLIGDSPNLVKVRDNVLGEPNIKAWVDKRPKTEV